MILILLHLFCTSRKIKSFLISLLILLVTYPYLNTSILNIKSLTYIINLKKSHILDSEQCYLKGESVGHLPSRYSNQLAIQEGQGRYKLPHAPNSVLTSYGRSVIGSNGWEMYWYIKLRTFNHYFFKKFSETRVLE